MKPPGGDPESKLEETYRRYASSRRKQRSWSATNRGNVAIRRELIGAISELARGPLAGSGEILDVGCGTGWLLAELASQGVEPRRLHGVDLLEARVAAARERLPGADVRFADARALPFEHGRFELVTLLTTLSSMPDRDSIARALREADRIVSPSGIVLCYEPRIPNPFNRATVTISNELLRTSLGSPSNSRRLTGFPPLARRLGPWTDRLYPLLALLAPSHRVTVHGPASARGRRG